MIFHPGITHLRTSPSSIFSDQILKDDWNFWELEKHNQIKYIATKVQWTCAKFAVSEPLSLNEMISALAILLSFYSFLLRTKLKTLTSALFVGLRPVNFKLCVSNMIKRSVSAGRITICSIFVEIYPAVAMSDFRLLWVHSLTDLPSPLIYGAEPMSAFTVQSQYKLMLSGKKFKTKQNIKHNNIK